MRVDRLARMFSHSSLRVPVSQELEDSLAQDAEELPSALALRRPHREWEPLRTKLGFVYHRLQNTLRPSGREPGYADAQALRCDLELVLAHVHSRHVARGSIRRLLWQVDVFGFHLAGIDIRQGAGVSLGERIALQLGDETIVIPDVEIVVLTKHVDFADHRGRLAEARRNHHAPLAVDLGDLPVEVDAIEKLEP